MFMVKLCTEVSSVNVDHLKFIYAEKISCTKFVDLLFFEMANIQYFSILSKFRQYIQTKKMVQCNVLICFAQYM